MKTSSWWRDAPEPATHPPLEGDRRTDVVVVGAGITGLTTALLLARAGRKVVVLEGDHVGAGTTGHTSAHLTVETDTDLDQLRYRAGEEGARIAVQANRQGIERIATLDQEMGGRGGFTRVPGYLWGTTDREMDRIEQMARLYAEFGETVSALVDVPLPTTTPKGMRLEDQGLFHPVRYLLGLAELATREGVEIFERTRVVDWSSGKPVQAVTRQGTVQADDLVLATHTPPGMVPTVQTRMGPYLSFLVVARAALAPGLYWDMADPYHYVRPLGDGRVLIGGEDFRPGKGDPREALASLEAWARAHLGADDFEDRWTHMWFEPADGIPYIGRLPLRNGAWVGTGYSGTGLTWGTFAAERITAGILGQESDDDKVFSPGRLGLVGGADRMVQDQAEVMWNLIADRLKPNGDHHPQDLMPGQGRVLNVDGRKVGVYRDEAGELHAVSAICKHMGCVVGWNPLDRTWDCPCHGGRFQADGTRFWGPPMGDLERRKL